MANKVGKLIKEARTAAGMTQEQLAKKVKNVSASDISKAERGELRLSQDALKQIAKATGVTQKSLLDAASSSAYKNSTVSNKSNSTSSSKSSMQVTATEKKLIQLYREASTDTKKKALAILKGEDPGLIGAIIDAVGGEKLLTGTGNKKQNPIGDILNGLIK